MRFLEYDNLIDPLLKNLRVSIAAFAGLNPGQSVLDVCCGTGAQVRAYAQLGAVAAGIDLSPKMLAIAKRNSAKTHHNNISFQLADAAALPFPDHSFDAASVTFGLHDKPEGLRVKIVSEMIRVVKPGGFILLADFTVPLPGNIWGFIARSIERNAGGSHYAGFRNYVASGGLDTILNTHHVREERIAQFLNGLVTAVKTGPVSS